jgi:hypothetical protein
MFCSNVLVGNGRNRSDQEYDPLSTVFLPITFDRGSSMMKSMKTKKPGWESLWFNHLKYLLNDKE